MDEFAKTSATSDESTIQDLEQRVLYNNERKSKTVVVCCHHDSSSFPVVAAADNCDSDSVADYDV